MFVNANSLTKLHDRKGVIEASEIGMNCATPTLEVRRNGRHWTFRHTDTKRSEEGDVIWWEYFYHSQMHGTFTIRVYND